jgi:hypothetical protein
MLLEQQGTASAMIMSAMTISEVSISAFSGSSGNGLPSPNI